MILNDQLENASQGHFWLLPRAHRVRTRRALPARCKCYRQGHLQKPAQCGTNVVMPHKYTKWPRSPTKQSHFSSSESCWVQSIHIPASICAAIQSARHGLPCLQRVKKTTELDTFIWRASSVWRWVTQVFAICTFTPGVWAKGSAKDIQKAATFQPLLTTHCRDLSACWSTFCSTLSAWLLWS